MINNTDYKSILQLILQSRHTQNQYKTFMNKTRLKTKVQD